MFPLRLSVSASSSRWKQCQTEALNDGTTTTAKSPSLPSPPPSLVVEWGRGLNEFGRGGEGGRKREGLFSPSSIRYRHTLTLSSFLLLDPVRLRPLSSKTDSSPPRKGPVSWNRNSMEFSYTYRICRTLLVQTVIRLPREVHYATCVLRGEIRGIVPCCSLFWFPPRVCLLFVPPAPLLSPRYIHPFVRV